VSTSALAIAGCAQILGIDPWGAGGAGATGTTSDSGSASTGSGCEGDAVCVHPPAGWSRVVALTAADGACDATFGNQVAAGVTDVVGADATCGCTCDAPLGGSCGAGTIHLFNDGGCTMALGDVQASPTCSGPISGAAANTLGATFSAPAATPGSCTEHLAKSVPPGSATNRKVCELSVAGSPCGQEGTCAAVPSGALSPAVCVFAEGDRPCPGGDFTNKTILFRGPVVDTRDCSACGCQTPTDAACSGTGTIFVDGSCGTTKTVVGAACTPVTPAGAQSVKATVTLSPGTCAIVPSTPTGSFVASDPVTVCCTNPLGGAG
jgi:hypothetical protein